MGAVRCSGSGTRPPTSIPAPRCSGSGTVSPVLPVAGRVRAPGPHGPSTVSREPLGIGGGLGEGDAMRTPDPWTPPSIPFARAHVAAQGVTKRRIESAVRSGRITRLLGAVPAVETELDGKIAQCDNLDRRPGRRRRLHGCRDRLVDGAVFAVGAVDGKQVRHGVSIACRAVTASRRAPPAGLRTVPSPGESPSARVPRGRRLSSVGPAPCTGFCRARPRRSGSLS